MLKNLSADHIYIVCGHTDIIELNADVVENLKNYVGYMALRPGTEKRGQHSLFIGCDKPIELNRVVQEVAHHQGIVMVYL